MSNIKLFQSKKIRSAWNEEEQKWYFSVADVVEALTDSTDIKQYVKRLRQRDEQLNSNWGTICTLLEMTAADGKKRKILAASVEGLLRIIQSIPSPKAVPFKRWLAKPGYDVSYVARPLNRTIQKYLVNPLSQELLMGNFSDGDTIQVSQNKDAGLDLKSNLEGFKKRLCLPPGRLQGFAISLISPHSKIFFSRL